MKNLVLVAVGCGLAGQAMAGGMSEPVTEGPVAAAPEPAPSFDWTGFYAGLAVTNGTASDVTDFDTSGYGVQAGYLRDLGTFVLGGELAYSDADVDTPAPTTIQATRLKLIGAFDAGRFLPYAFVGLSDIKISGPGPSLSDTVTNYGLGGRFAFGADGRFVAGLEYIVEDKDNFADSGFDLGRDELALRLDYRF